MNVSLWNIFLVFFKVGALLLGGGYVILPLLTAEIVEKRPWITKEELVNFYSISQCLPGIIAVNTAIFTGYKLKGKTGGFVAVFAMCLSPFIVILCLASILAQLTTNPIIINIFWGVGIGILIMLLLTVKEIWEKSIVDKFTLFLFLLIFLLTAIFDISPVFSILGASILGIIYKLYQRRFIK